MRSRKSGASGAQAEFVPINFNGIPEVSIEHLDPEVRRIKKLTRSDHSFGAFVVRRGGAVLAKDFALRFSNSSRRVNVLPFGRVDGPLHTDIGSRNRVTALLLTSGIADVLVLTGGEIKSGDTISAEATAAIFNGLVNTADLSVPSDPTRTQLEPDDVLVFDHNQPHAVRTVVGPRHTLAFYPTL